MLAWESLRELSYSDSFEVEWHRFAVCPAQA